MVTINDARECIKKILQYLGENPDREGLLKTPDRVVKSWDTLFGGYLLKPESVLEVTFKECSQYDEMIILRDIEFYSTCEHHMLPFFGKVHVAYLPELGDSCKVVGVSKLARLVDIHARRLQIQERMTQDIAMDLEKAINARGVGVIVEAQHFCMTSRGVQKKHSIMSTSAMRGEFRTIPMVRQEFLQLVKGA